MFKSKLAKILLGLFVIFLLSSGYQYYKLDKQKFKFDLEVKKWFTLRKIEKKLCNKNIISNCFLWKIWFFLHKINNIKPGYYEFSGETLKEIINQLQKWPKIKYVKFTILPWETKFDISEKLNNKQKKVFLNLMTDKIFIKKISQQYPYLKTFWELNSLEGFLYPDTYFFKKSDLKSILFPQLLIKTAIKNFYKKTKNLNWKNNYNLSKYQILILASIVEKEESNPINKPYVANILIRRYLNNWKLWADWTLCYGLNLGSKKCYSHLTYQNLINKSNPYNTRANKGLPPTPVSNPTIETIKSVIKSKPNNYWYYLHDKNWNIHYAKTANEHTLNKNTYLR